ncbi:unnamed protein product [Didymodactylos carnosus]|uniref:DDE Tnp4 domain-containing protein n=1 Tax=Didymodactylos carnosus TaxID=1234261 RepID=A0A815KNW0_9BILA|nr:unnamed protein product [Didymodactylos carnosus]CAF4292830.1 unnamed protein product [Didymodactylos carnosus]
MSMCLPDGYCLDIRGPFYGNKNDARISDYIVSTKKALEGWCENDDVMICDRGFRDVVDVFSELGYEPKMPVYLKKGQNQHTTKEANESRLVTKVRWVVESFHARLKKFRLLSERIDNQLVPKPEQCVRITAAALNKYRGAIVQNKNSEEDKKLAELMKSYVAQNNTLLEQVASGKLNARQRWLPIGSIDFDFPEMDLDDLRKLFFGCYQIKQTTTYAEEHLDVHGDFAIQVSRES